MLRHVLVLLFALLAAPGYAQEDFTITGIRVDVSGPSADAARRAGWRLAQRKAWPQLYARLTGAAPAVAPRLGDSALDSVVSGIEVQRELIGPARYIATLAVAFDRSRASGFLGSSARLLRSSPMLIMPVELSGGTRIVFERRGPWAEAWRRFRTDVSPIAYVRPAGTGGDALVLTAYQAYRPNRDLWRAALARYSAANVLIAEARLDYAWPGGPLTGRFRALAGPDARVLAAFTMQAGNAEEVQVMLDTAIERMDAAYTAALRQGELRAEQDLIAPIDGIVLGDVIGAYAPTIGSSEPLNTIVVTVAASDEGAAAAFEAAILAAQGIQGAAAIGDNQIRIDYRGSLDRLRYDLDQAGLRLEGSRLRQRLEGEALLPPPIIAPIIAPPAPALPAPDAAAAAGNGGGDTLVTDAPPTLPPAPPAPPPSTPPREPAVRPEDAPAPRPGG